MPRLAFLTIGSLQAVWGSPSMQSFMQSTPAVFASAASSEGCLAVLEGEADPSDPAGPVAPPRVFQNPGYDNRLAATLTLWQDLELVFAFAYHGVHAEALTHRKEWFDHGSWPPYVAWWVNDDHTPTVAEAHAHYDQLHQHGPTPTAFDFKQPFGPDGQPAPLDRAEVRAKVARRAPEPPTGAPA